MAIFFLPMPVPAPAGFQKDARAPARARGRARAGTGRAGILRARKNTGSDPPPASISDCNRTLFHHFFLQCWTTVGFFKILFEYFI